MQIKEEEQKNNKEKKYLNIATRGPQEAGGRGRKKITAWGGKEEEIRRELNDQKDWGRNYHRWWPRGGKPYNIPWENYSYFKYLTSNSFDSWELPFNEIGIPPLDEYRIIDISNFTFDEINVNF